MGAAPFINRQDVSDRIGRDVTADAGALSAVDSACEIVRTIAEQQFDAITMDTITLDGTGTDCLLLPELPVSAAGTVVVAGGTVTDYVLADNGKLIRTAGTVASSSLDAWLSSWWGWSPYSNTGFATPSYDRRLFGATWPLGRQNVAVTYDHGSVDVPRDVREVALNLAIRAVVQGQAIQEQVGDVNIRYAVAATDLTKGEERILRKHRPTR